MIHAPTWLLLGGLVYVAVVALILGGFLSEWREELPARWNPKWSPRLAFAFAAAWPLLLAVGLVAAALERFIARRSRPP